MNLNSTSIVCDGCGLPASPEHIAARVERLESATRFRPIHIDTLFVALAPMPLREDDFYRPPESRDFFDPFLSALGILPETGMPGAKPNASEAGIARLLEFQRKGYYLTYLSECPLPLQADAAVARESVSKLAPIFVKRLRFNYRPKHVRLLDANVQPLIETLKQAGMGSLLEVTQVAP